MTEGLWFNVLKIAGFYPSPKKTTYMVKNSIWEEAGTLNRTAGIDELEMSLGRELTLDDFTPAPANWSDYFSSYHSENPIARYSFELKEKRIGKEGRKKLAREWLNNLSSSEKERMKDRPVYQEALELINS